MDDEGFSGSAVVGLRLRIDGFNNVIRVEGTVETFLGGRRLYEEKVEYVTTWTEALAFLATLLGSVDAERPVGTYLTLVQPT